MPYTLKRLDGSVIFESPASETALDAIFSYTRKCRELGQLPNFIDADLRNLTGCKGITFFNASFIGADLSNSNFRNSTFERCNFRGAILDNAELQSCSFFRSTGLTAVMLSAAHVDRYTDLRDTNIGVCEICTSVVPSSHFRGCGHAWCYACQEEREAESSEDEEDEESDYEHHDNGLIRAKVIRSHPAPDKYRGPDGRMVGVELEFNNIRSADAVNEWALNWGAGLHTDGSCGYEAVTPPVAGPHIRSCITQLLHSLRSSRATADERCGIHVHVDVKDLRWEDMRRLLDIYVRIEPLLYVLGGQQRLTNQYCAPLAPVMREHRTYYPSAKTAIMCAVYNRTAEGVKRVMRAGPHKKDGGRYRGLNLCPWLAGRSSSKRIRPDTTVEFRLHRNSLDAKRVTEWALLCGRIVSYAAKASDADIRALPKSSLRALCDHIAPDSKAWILSRIKSWREHTTPARIPSGSETLNGKYPRRVGFCKHPEYNLYQATA